MTRVPMKILHVTMIDVGGAWKVVQRLHVGLSKSGTKIESLVLSPKKSYARRKIYNLFSKIDLKLSNKSNNILTFSIFRPISTRLLLIGYKRRIQTYDIIHVHWVPGFLQKKDKYTVHSKLVWTIHDLEAFTGGCHQNYGCDKFEKSCSVCPQALPFMQSKISRSVQQKIKSRNSLKKIALVAPSNWLADQIRKSAVFYGLDVNVIGNPIPSSIFNSKGSSRAFDKSEVTIGILGSNYPQGKGAQEALNLLKCFQSSFEGIINVVVFGTPHASLSCKSIPDNSSDEEISNALKGCDFFFYYSKGETFGNFVAEAAACGVIVVSSGIGALSELILDGRTGLIVDINSELDIKKLHLVANSSQKRIEMSMEAQKFIETRFGSEIIAQKYLDLYHSL